MVDEVDSILIDESRNPMLISQPLYDNQDTVDTVNRVSKGTGRRGLSLTYVVEMPVCQSA